MADAFAAIASMKNSEVDAVNNMREAGIRANIASGNKQLVFNTSGIEFASREIMPHMPKGATINHLRVAVQLAARLPKPVESSDELRGIRVEIQQMLALCGFGEPAKRRELQSARGRNFFADGISKLLDFRVLIESVEKEEPMENWTDDMLDEFLVSVQPIRDRIQRAEKIRLGLAK